MMKIAYYISLVFWALSLIGALFAWYRLTGVDGLFFAFALLAMAFFGRVIAVLRDV